MATKTRNIIRDGYTRRGRIDAIERLHDSLDFEFRPMLPEQVEDLDAAVDKCKPKEAAPLVAAAMAEQLTSWSEVEGEGDNEKMAPITVDNLRRLPYPLLSRLRKVVAGLAPTDALSDASDDEQSDYIIQLRAKAAGKPAGLELLSSDQKN